MIEDKQALAEDAEKWRALMACARIKMMGGAGLSADSSNFLTDFAHIGIELWTQHEGSGDEQDRLGRHWFDKFMTKALKVFREKVKCKECDGKGRWDDASHAASRRATTMSEVESADWPPRFTVTAEGAIRLILARYDADGNVGKAELAILELMRQSYKAGKSGSMASP